MLRKIILAAMLCVLLPGCTGLQRGMSGSTYVSSAKPAFSVSVPGMPLRAAGSATPSLTTEDALGGVPIETWIAVYGGTAVGQPMAIVVQAEIPPAWYWDSNMYRSFSIDQGVTVIDGKLFQSCIYIIDGSSDAFSSLVPDADPNALRWIARRFAIRTNFNSGKIILEYREPLPQNFASLTDLPQGGQTFLAAFAERAEKAFVFSLPMLTGGEVQTSYVQGLRIRYLNNNFLGTMSRYDFLD